MKMHFELLPAALLVTSILLGGCDQIEGPVKDYDHIQSSTSQKVLLEDFTGHTCGHCPKAHDAASDLMEVYKDKVILVAIHAGGFAEPTPGLGYPADFRTPEGEEIEAHFDVETAGFPKGMINRRTFGGNALLNYSSWGGHIAAVLTEEPEAGIDLTAVLDPTTRIVDIGVDVEYYEGGNFTHHLVVIVTEDSVVSRQTDYRVTPSDVDGYYQRHMLRGSVTDGTWGNAMASGSVSLGQTFTQDFSYKLDESWDTRHCSIVAYVMDATTQEVIQVEEVHLHE
jgi:thiol-disulfide isomerase/thioredoxin